MKANLRDIIYYIDGSILEKAKNEKAQKQESSSKVSKDVEEVITKYCDEIFASGAETEEFFYRLGIKAGLRLKSRNLLLVSVKYKNVINLSLTVVRRKKSPVRDFDIQYRRY